MNFSRWINGYKVFNHKRKKIMDPDNIVQRIPSCLGKPYAPEIWPIKRGGLLSGEAINTFMFRFTLSSCLSRWVGI